MKIMGSFDLIEEGIAHGWVCDADALDKKLSVEFFSDGKLVGYGNADLFRKDIEELGIGDGRYHFKIPLSYELFDGGLHQVIARLSKSGGVIYGGPHAIQQLRSLGFDVISHAEGVAALKQVLRGSQFEANLEKLLQHFSAASFLQETLQLTNARRGYKKIVEVIGDNALIATKVAETYMLAQSYSKALSAYESALAMDPHFYWARLGYANVLRLTGKLLDAYHSYQHAMQIEPAHSHSRMWVQQIGPEVDMLRADSQIEQRDFQGAAQLLKRIVFAHPDHPVAVSKLTEVLMEQHALASVGSGIPVSPAVRDFWAAQRLLEFIVEEAEQTLLEEKK